MKKIFSFLPLVLFVSVLCSCGSDDPFSPSSKKAYPPTWKGFELRPDRSHIYAGDTVRATACQDMKGHLINATTYTWTLTLDTLNADESASAQYVYQKSVHTNYDGTNDGDPSYTFRMPANAVPNGRATISFAAQYSYSADGIEVSINQPYDQSTGLGGSIYSQSATLYGKANGSVSFYVKKR